MDVPDLVGVHHQRVPPPALLADERGAVHVVGEAAADLHLEVRPALAERLAQQASYLLVRVAEPPGGGRVGRVAALAYRSLALRLSRFAAAQDVERLVRR